MEVPLFLAFAVVMLVVVLFFNAQAAKQRAEVLEAAAEQYGLKHATGSPTSRVSGTVDGIPLVIEAVERGSGDSQQIRCRVEAEPTCVLPQDLYVGSEGLLASFAKVVGMQDVEVGDPEFDRAAILRGARPDHLQQVFESPRLRLASRFLVSNSNAGSVESGKVAMETSVFQAHSIAPLVDQVLETARALDDAILGPWQVFAEDASLELDTSARVVRASGVTPEGYPIEVRGALETGQTTITVELPTPLPNGLVAMAGEHPGAVALGDPILDGRVSVKGANADAVRQLCRDAAVREELLAALSVAPDSRVEDGVVRIVATAASVDALRARYRDACGLAHALVERLAAVPSRAHHRRRVPE